MDIATIASGTVPVDPHSLQVGVGNPASVDRFLKDEAAIRKIEASKNLADVSAGDYAAIFLPGGHGTM